MSFDWMEISIWNSIHFAKCIHAHTSKQSDKITISQNVFLYFKILNFMLFSGLAASQDEPTKRPNFAHRKLNRNNRPKATRPTPAAISDDEEEVPTSPQCPESYGFFADSEQCDKYYACR